MLEVLEVKFGHLSSVFCEWAMPEGKTGPSAASRPGSEHQNTPRVSLEENDYFKASLHFLSPRLDPHPMLEGA